MVRDLEEVKPSLIPAQLPAWVAFTHLVYAGHNLL